MHFPEKLIIKRSNVGKASWKMRVEGESLRYYCSKWHGNTESEISGILGVLIYFDANQSYGYLGNPHSYWTSR